MSAFKSALNERAFPIYGVLFSCKSRNVKFFGKFQASSNSRVDERSCRYRQSLKVPKSIRVLASPRCNARFRSVANAVCFRASSKCPRLLFPALFVPKMTVNGARRTCPVSFQALKFWIRNEVSIVSSVARKCNLSLPEALDSGSGYSILLFISMEILL